jgi:hypothetical protein
VAVKAIVLDVQPLNALAAIVADGDFTSIESMYVPVSPLKP